MEHERPETFVLLSGKFVMPSKDFGSNGPRFESAVAAALSPWTRLFTPFVPRRSLHISFYYGYLAILVKYTLAKKKKKVIAQNGDVFSLGFLF